MGERQGSDGGAPSRRSFCYALSCWTLSVSAMVISVAYSSLNQLPKSASSFQGGPANGPVAVVFVGAFATVGALLAWKRPANAIGWLLSAAALSFSCGGISLLFAYEAGTLTLAKWLGWIWLFGLGLIVPVLLIFPTGRLLSRRWRPVAWASSAGLAAWVLGNTFAPTIITADVKTTNPVGLSGAAGKAFQALAIAGALILLGCGLAAIASLVIRYRRAQLIEREQLKWLVFASALIVVALVIEVAMQNVLGSTEASTDLQNAISSGAAALVPVAIGVAVFRYRLYDIDVVISKTLVYGSLAAFITGVYIAIVVGLGSLLADHRDHPSLVLPIIATAIVAIAFQPVRERAQRLANRLVYGKRATPYEVLADLAAQTAGTYATEQVLPQMARILAAGTAAARADVWLASGGELRNDATWPPDAPLLRPISTTQASDPLACPGTDRILPVRHQGELLGALSVTKRPGDSLTPTEGRLLEDLAAHVGLVLRNVGLWEELTARLEDIRASRRRLVAAQDAERRRVERNIHDGAQQHLVALAIKLSLVESMIGVDPAGEREMLSELGRTPRRRQGSCGTWPRESIPRSLWPRAWHPHSAHRLPGRPYLRNCMPKGSAGTRRRWRRRPTSVFWKLCRTLRSTQVRRRHGSWSRSPVATSSSKSPTTASGSTQPRVPTDLAYRASPTGWERIGACSRCTARREPGPSYVVGCLEPR